MTKMKRTATLTATFGLLGSMALTAGTSGVASAQQLSGPYKASSTWTDVGPTPHFSAVDVRLHKVFVSNLAAGTVTVLDSTTGAKLGTVLLGGTVHTVAVDQKNQRVYVTDIARGLLDVINARTDAVIAHIPVGSHLHGLAVSQRLHDAFVTDIYNSKIYVVDINTDTVVDPSGIAVGPNPWGVAVNPVTRMVYVANTGIDPYAGTATNPQGVNPAGNSVSVINLKSMSVVDTITVGPHPWNVVADTRNNTVYVGVASANEVAVINNGAVGKNIAVGASPHGLALDPRNGTLFVNNSLSDNASLIDTASNSVSQTIAVGGQPQGISVDALTGAAYVVNQASASVSVLTPSS